MKILGSMWFTPMGNNGIIGIVIINNGFENRAYIGSVANPTTEINDAVDIASIGASFPLETAKSLIGI